MGNMPWIEHDIREYMTIEKQEDILKRVSDFLKEIDNQLPEIEIKNLSLVTRTGLADADGYTSNEIKLGRYCSGERIIKFNVEDMPSKANDLRYEFIKNEKLIQYGKYALTLCDLVIIHECMHAFQDQIEKKRIIHGNRLLEEEANRRMAIIYVSMYHESNELKRKTIEKFIQMSEYKFGDKFSLDELFIKKDEISYRKSFF